MSEIRKIDKPEHSEIEDDFDKEISIPLGIDDIKLPGSENKDVYRGIYKEGGIDEEFRKVKTGYYVGIWWAYKDAKNLIISISPKNNVDFISVFNECIKNKEVRKHLSNTYKIITNEKPISVKKEEKVSEINFLIIFHFLKIVELIVKKGLKKSYKKTEENLTDKVKGKILINKNISKNLVFKNKTYCEYFTFTTDILENRIIKAALLVSKKFLINLNSNNEILNLCLRNLNHFEYVQDIKIYPDHFKSIKVSSFFQEYKMALHLSQIILKLYGYNYTNLKKEDMVIPSYYINMPLLFERYVECKLREKYKDKVTANWEEKKSEYIWGLRPDFEIINENELIIADAKYKFWYVDKNSDIKKSDYMQMALYGRINKIREKANKCEPKLYIFYPSDDTNHEKINEENLKKVDGFYKIYEIPLYFPIKKK